MATTVVFGNKICKLPGSYARVVSGIPRETPLASYNNFLLIDTGFSNGFNSLKGIQNENSGKECIFPLTQEEANYYIKGGPLEPVINGLFEPDPDNNKPGISTLYLIKAAKTTSANIETTFEKVSLFEGKIQATSIKTVEHGPICNTYPSNITKVDDLKKGFVLVCKYDKESGKGWVEIWQGGYRGTNLGNFEIGNTEKNAIPILLWRSKKCKDLTTLINYLNNSASGFSNYFEIAELTDITADHSFGTKDIEELKKLVGGSETYITKTSELSDILGYTLDSDYSCMMIAEAQGNTNFVATALDHIVNEARGIKMIISAKAEQEDAIQLAQESNSDYLIVTANQGKNKNKISPTGFINHDALVTAAKVAGRIFGLSPEIPGTLKSLGFDGMVIEPSDIDLENMLDAGVITPYYDADLGYFVMSQAVNSLQQNSELINEDCSTFSIQCKRILAQVIKNLVKQSKVDFWGSKNGDKAANKANLSEAYVKAWTETQLNRLSIAPNKTDNNYLITYEVTKVEIVQDYINVYLSVTVNGEITKVFFLVTVLG